ncbi:MAG TPA: DNA repair protein RadA, partial [Levilactobacillus hammesii]|nr:DNA repair protein RadA [Levilactobacillus hammesii]
ESRVAEAKKLGFKRIFVPKNNMQGWKAPEGIQVVGVSTLRQALKLALDV